MATLRKTKDSGSLNHERIIKLTRGDVLHVHSLVLPRGLYKIYLQITVREDASHFLCPGRSCSMMLALPTLNLLVEEITVPVGP